MKGPELIARLKQAIQKLEQEQATIGQKITDLRTALRDLEGLENAGIDIRSVEEYIEDRLAT